MRVLVTGGAGFIGSTLVRTLLAAGHDVVVLDDLSTGYRKNIKGLPITFLHGSILDDDLLENAAEGADSIVHLAAMGSVPLSIDDPVACHAINATGTFKVLEAARALGVKQVIMASSSAVYGSNPSLPKSERDWVRPMTPYAVTKLAGEQYALAYQDSYGLETLAFRFFNVYGPRQDQNHPYAAVIPVWTHALLTDQPLYINGDGSHTRDFIYVGSLAAVLSDAVTRGVTHPEPINAAFGTETSLNDLVRALEAATDRKATVIHREPRAGDVLKSLADNAVQRSLFPDVTAVPLREGLAETVAWFQETLALQ